MSAEARADPSVEAVRAFNRSYTKVIGLLREGLLRTPYSLPEARVIFELGRQEQTELGALRRELDLDGGYLSRLLARLEGKGLVSRERSPEDRRRQVVGLTAEGRSAFEDLDERSADENRALLRSLGDADRRRLIAAMGTIRGILEGAPRDGALVVRPPGPGELGWIVERHGALYAEEYGWDERFEALVARIVADYAEGRDPKRESAWIAEVDGEPAGCVLCVRKDDRVAQLRLLLVEPSARGRGIGTRLVAECVRFARWASYERIALWTNDVLEDARRIYERAGFELTDEEPHESFGRPVVGQTWSRSL